MRTAGPPQDDGTIFVFAEEPERGWWEIRPAWAVRKVGEDRGEPYLLALDQDELAALIGEGAVVAVRTTGEFAAPQASTDGGRGRRDPRSSANGKRTGPGPAAIRALARRAS